jgi:hypothetical protein
MARVTFGEALDIGIREAFTCVATRNLPPPLHPLGVSISLGTSFPLVDLFSSRAFAVVSSRGIDGRVPCQNGGAAAGALQRISDHWRG